MLFVESVEIPTDSTDILECILCNEFLRKQSDSFKSEIRDTYPTRARSLHVCQGEQAFLQFGDGRPSSSYIIGSEDATTCVIAVALSLNSTAAWVAHFDEGTVLHDHSFLEIADEFIDGDLYLMGAFQESSGVSLKICKTLLHFFHRNLQHPLHLQLACIYTFNTMPDSGLPMCYNLAVDCASRQAYSASFVDRGPAIPRRMAHPHCHDKGSGHPSLVHVFDPVKHQIQLPGFNPSIASWQLMRLQALLLLDDASFLKECSTSPCCERSNFVADVKAAYSWLLKSQGISHILPAQYAWNDASHKWDEVVHVV